MADLKCETNHLKPKLIFPRGLRSSVVPEAPQKAIAVASVLYISPEMAPGSHRFLFQCASWLSVRIAVAVDEAHCVLHWGREFQTLYGGLFR